MKYFCNKKFLMGVALAILFSLSLIFWVFPNGEKQQTHSDVPNEVDESSHEEKESKSLKLSSRYVDDFKIKIEKPQAVVLLEEIVLPGEIKVNQDTMVHLYPRFPGIVKKIKKNLGDLVEAKEVIAILESNNSLVEYEIISPISGVVIGKDANVGENMNGTFPAFEIADFSTVWAEIDIYQKDLPLVKVGQTIYISSGHNRPPVEAKIDYINPTVSESTRTGLARAIIPNNDMYWRPGMFITAKVIVGDSVIDLAVKKPSIQKIEGKDSIFIKKEGDLFEVRAVKLGRNDTQYVEVLQNLNSEELYVAEGSFVLKAEFEKDSLSGGHGH